MPPGCQVASNEARREKAAVRGQDLAPLVWPLIENGRTYREVAEELNRRRFVTAQGRPRGWTANAIAQVTRSTKDEFGGYDYVRGKKRASINYRCQH